MAPQIFQVMASEFQLISFPKTGQYKLHTSLTMASNCPATSAMMFTLPPLASPDSAALTAARLTIGIVSVLKVAQADILFGFDLNKF